jgi:hypothetical protein
MVRLNRVDHPIHSNIVVVPSLGAVGSGAGRRHRARGGKLRRGFRRRAEAVNFVASGGGRRVDDRVVASFAAAATRELAAPSSGGGQAHGPLLRLRQRVSSARVEGQRVWASSGGGATDGSGGGVARGGWLKAEE